MIDDLTIDQIDEDILLIRWGILSVTDQNYTQSITIQDSSSNTHTIIITDNDNQYYWYELDNPNTCTEYNITLNFDTIITTCNDSRTVSKYYITTGKIITGNN